MRLGSIFRSLVAVALLCQAAAATSPTDPASVVSRQSVFAIPFRVDRVDDPAQQPMELHLYVSTNRGARWQLYTKARPTDEQFLFHAGADGEYWFAIRTVDRSGQIRPETIAEPGLRVLVDTNPLDSRPAPPKAPAAVHAPMKSDDADPLTTADATGSVAIAINPAVGSKFGASANPSGNTGAASGLPAGERPRMVNSRLFELEYDVDSVGPSGIGKVELWGTRDSGKTWRKFARDSDCRSPMLVSVEEEGVYGFRVVVTNGAGLGGKLPQSGDLPDLWIGVDLTKPVAEIVSAKQGLHPQAGSLVITWRADDKVLADRPVSLLFRENRTGPWLPIASGLENTGRYAWPIDKRTPPQLYLRLEVRDEAGNVAVCQASEPVAIDQSCPTIRVRDVRPVGQTSARPTWQAER